LLQIFEPEYTLDLLDMETEYHVDITRSKFTPRNIAATFKEVREELINALEELILTGDDSK
jgi:hypothetical protein